MRPAPLVPYLTALCLATMTVVALDAALASWPATVARPEGGTASATSTPGSTPGSAPGSTPESTPPEPRSVDTPPLAALRSAADLPPGRPFPQHGTGTWRVVPPPSAAGGTGFAYTVEVEDGVALPNGDDAFAAVVDHALRHPRGWSVRYAFRRVGGDVEPDLRIRLTSQQTARALCGFEMPFDTSCRVGSTVHLNTARWFRGAHTYDGDLRDYQVYAVNHEVGHFLGFGHEVCPVDGGPAPLMMQQTLSTDNDELAAITAGSDQGVVVVPDGKACEPNPWPSW
ncbi:DUF3152 domain-containing protein [Saccharothrix hoggarensis]|uniref:DUF3152 domain-containing protein n=1 Tax=Saccharothrix hoggarensis TaxID=913853 RepID=A0ABW3QUB1_9PSEU